MDDVVPPAGLPSAAVDAGIGRNLGASAGSVSSFFLVCCLFDIGDIDKIISKPSIKTEIIIKEIANLLFEINLISFCILQLFLTIEIYSQILSHFSQGLNIFYFPAMN